MPKQATGTAVQLVPPRLKDAEAIAGVIAKAQELRPLLLRVYQIDLDETQPATLLNLQYEVARLTRGARMVFNRQASVASRLLNATRSTALDGLPFVDEEDEHEPRSVRRSRREENEEEETPRRRA